MKKSKLGYKRYSPDVNNPYNIIPSGRITMRDVDFPVYGIDDMGNAQMMYPGGEYQFPGNQVFELPMAQKGKSVGSALSEYKERPYENFVEVFDITGLTSHDDAKRAYDSWQQSGQSFPSFDQGLDMFGAVPAIGKFGKLRYLADPGAMKPVYKYLPWQQILNAYDSAQDELEKKSEKKQIGGEQLQTPQPYIRPNFFTPEQIRKARIDAAKDRPLTFEGRINKALGNPKERAADLAQEVAPRGEGPVDNIRHTVAGMYTADAIANQLSPYPIGPTTVVPKIAGFMGSNLAGLAHEAKAFIPSLEGDYRNIPAAARTTAEDVVNNFVGSALSLNPFMTQGEKEELIVRLSDENYLPDGYEQMNSKHPKNLYVKKEYGGDLEEFGSGGLKQWFAEKWVDVKTGKECGRSGKDKDGRPYPACRPSRRVNSTTPKTTSEMSSSEKAKFKSVKISGKRIPYNHRRAEMGGSLDFESPVTAFEYMINPEYRYQLGGIATAFTPLMVAAQAKLSSLFDSDEPATKSAPKPVDWTQMKRPDQIKYGIDQIVALEPEDRRKSLENLLEATAYMENRYGADPRAYGRSYTSSFMSIDPIALKDMFTGRGNKGVYNAAQRAQIENFKRLNLPTDQKQFDVRLRKDDPVAAMAAARYRYAMVPQALPDANNPQQMFDYWLKYYNGQGVLKHQSREQAYKDFLKGYKMAIGND